MHALRQSGKSMPTKKHHSISEVAKLSGLSRSTLLYYDKKGILRPSLRDANKYRLYSEEDVHALQKLCLLKDLGIPLDVIANILQQKQQDMTQILNRRLLELNAMINKIRQHQRTIVTLLGNEKLLKHTRSMNKELWVQILRSTGMSDKDMSRWHQEFEHSAPQAHQDFLESLGLDAKDIKQIRIRSRMVRK